jgi:hypothetical protein
MRRGTMIKSKKQFILKIFIGIIISTMLYTIGFSCIYHNGSGRGFDDPDDPADGVKSDSKISELIEVCAGYFLNGNSDFLSFLNRVELQNLSGIDYNEWQQILDTAIDNIKNAKESFLKLIQKAEITPYNKDVVSKLISFGYDEFMEKNCLNNEIFKKVEYYLSAGDIIGNYKLAYNSICTIEEMLNSIKNELLLNKIPELYNLWKLNEIFSETLIYGQYVARVFYAIL